MSGKAPLVNTELKKLPFGPHLKNEIAKNVKIPVIAKRSTPNYKQPSAYLTTKIVKKIHEIEEEEPDLSQMLDKKLESPFTSRALQKKVR